VKAADLEHPNDRCKTGDDTSGSRRYFVAMRWPDGADPPISIRCSATSTMCCSSRCRPAGGQAPAPREPCGV